MCGLKFLLRLRGGRRLNRPDSAGDASRGGLNEDTPCAGDYEDEFQKSSICRCAALSFQHNGRGFYNKSQPSASRKRSRYCPTAAEIILPQKAGARCLPCRTTKFQGFVRASHTFF
jgi:hypothetical protein